MRADATDTMQLMRFYPEEPRQRRRTILRDGVFVAILLALFLLARAVHGAVDELAVLGEGVTGAGTSVQSGLDSAADAVDDIPLAGGALADGLRGAGEQTGGRVSRLGRQGEDAVHDLALLLGLAMFLVPASLALLWFLPPRVAQARKLTDARRTLAQTTGAEERRLLAMRAAFSLPYGVLLRHTADPFGDLAAGRYESLVAAAFEDAGLRPPATS